MEKLIIGVLNKKAILGYDWQTIYEYCEQDWAYYKSLWNIEGYYLLCLYIFFYGWKKHNAQTKFIEI